MLSSEFAIVNFFFSLHFWYMHDHKTTDRPTDRPNKWANTIEVDVVELKKPSCLVIYILCLQRVSAFVWFFFCLFIHLLSCPLSGNTLKFFFSFHISKDSICKLFYFKSFLLWSVDFFLFRVLFCFLFLWINPQGFPPCTCIKNWSV